MLTVSSSQLNLIHSIALTFAVTAVIRFYKVLKSHLAGHKPLAKLLAFKLLVGLNFALQVKEKPLTKL